MRSTRSCAPALSRSTSSRCPSPSPRMTLTRAKGPATSRRGTSIAASPSCPSCLSSSIRPSCTSMPIVWWYRTSPTFWMLGWRMTSGRDCSRPLPTFSLPTSSTLASWSSVPPPRFWTISSARPMMGPSPRTTVVIPASSMPTIPIGSPPCPPVPVCPSGTTPSASSTTAHTPRGLSIGTRVSLGPPEVDSASSISAAVQSHGRQWNAATLPTRPARPPTLRRPCRF
mmetsp:Transcript_20409/g.58566  ORF Transcript_20409/g.58566 Transcript_20409/m.58566 type:complete len:227 (-) Transcript_20409:663-1343(-)